MNAQVVFVEEWTPRVLVAIWAFAQSLILEDFPYAKEWYAKLEPRWKRFVQAIGLAIAAVLIMVLACTDILGGITCDKVGIINMVVLWIGGLAMNQGTHLIFKKSNGS